MIFFTFIVLITLNNSPLDYTVVGIATGTSYISGLFLLKTTLINSILTVRNPIGNPTALTITPLADGCQQYLLI